MAPYIQTLLGIQCSFVFNFYQEIERVKRSVDIPDWFSSMDLNENGVIDPLELDADFYDM